ncbi:MAG TPA: hypothetical protein IAC09_01935, partial [Candidatus Cryptobacteroides intestinipullorum]|nr:hypothetical protein [Candidatus Cryptobacteroides intestinipullorum]
VIESAEKTLKSLEEGTIRNLVQQADRGADVNMTQPVVRSQDVAGKTGNGEQAADAADRNVGQAGNGQERTAGYQDAGRNGAAVPQPGVRHRMTRPHNVREGRIESDGSLQLSFFQLDDPLLSSLRDDLVNVDINNLTPLQAFDLLRSMKEKMGI